MKKKEKNFGFLLFYDWFDLFYDLSPKHYKMLMNAMVFYQRYGTPPPEFPDKIKKIANLIFTQLDRRIANSENGRLGGEAKARAQMSSLPPLAAAGAAAGAASMAYRRDKEETKKSQEEKKQDNKYLLSDESAYLCGSYEPQIANGKLQMANGKLQMGNEDAEARGEIANGKLQMGNEDAEARGARGEMGNGKLQMGNGKLQIENEDIGLRTYGIHNNVFLTEGEYNMLRRDIPNADEYINTFSDKLVKKGYRYRDHYIAIRTWWERDRQYLNSASVQVNNEHIGLSQEASNGAKNSTFETDSFFEAALRRSEEEMNKYCIN